MKVKKESCLFFLIILCFLSFVYGIGSNLKLASGISEITLSTNVLEDFSSDNKFRLVDYPVDNSDFSLKVIQIAEVEDSLVVYVYQPCIQRDFRATSINISTALGDDLSFTNYKLTYLNSEETLYKYKVENLIVGSEDKRYYEVSSVFRDWNKFIDKEIDKITENTIDEVAYKVAKAYTFAGFGSEKVVFSQDVEVVEVLSKYVGFVRRTGGIPPFHEHSCDSHFIAFKTDKKIDRLMEAELQFLVRAKSENRTLFDNYISTEYGEWSTKKIEFTDTDKIVTHPLFNRKVVTQRIESVPRFFEIEKNLDKDIKNYIAEKDWVLRFFESSYSTQIFSNIKIYHSVEVGEVTLLRLKFETEGKIYNLGVVDNKQTGGDSPVNKTVMPYWAKILFLVGIGILAIVLIFVVAPQFIILLIKFVFEIMGWILKAIWWVLTLPIKIFKKD